MDKEIEAAIEALAPDAGNAEQRAFKLLLGRFLGDFARLADGVQRLAVCAEARERRIQGEHE